MSEAVLETNIVRIGPGNDRSASARTAESAAPLLFAAARDLLADKHGLKEIYTPGVYFEIPGYDPRLVPPLAEILGSAQISPAAVRRTIENLAARSDAFVLVAGSAEKEASGALVGWVETLSWNGVRQGCIEIAYVLPGRRKTGVGRALADAALAEFGRRDCRSAWGTLLDERVDVLDFWLKSRGRPWGRIVRHDVPSE